MNYNIYITCCMVVGTIVATTPFILYQLYKSEEEINALGFYRLLLDLIYRNEGRFVRRNN